MAMAACLYEEPCLLGAGCPLTSGPPASAGCCFTSATCRASPLRLPACSLQCSWQPPQAAVKLSVIRTCSQTLGLITTLTQTLAQTPTRP